MKGKIPRKFPKPNFGEFFSFESSPEERGRSGESRAKGSGVFAPRRGRGGDEHGSVGRSSLEEQGFAADADFHGGASNLEGQIAVPDGCIFVGLHNGPGNDDDLGGKRGKARS